MKESRTFKKNFPSLILKKQESDRILKFSKLVQSAAFFIRPLLEQQSSFLFIFFRCFITLPAHYTKLQAAPKKRKYVMHHVFRGSYTIVTFISRTETTRMIISPIVSFLVNHSNTVAILLRSLLTNVFHKNIYLKAKKKALSPKNKREKFRKEIGSLYKRAF